MIESDGVGCAHIFCEVDIPLAGEVEGGGKRGDGDCLRSAGRILQLIRTWSLGVELRFAGWGGNKVDVGGWITCGGFHGYGVISIGCGMLEDDEDGLVGT